jgi:hypothetical protein
VATRNPSVQHLVDLLDPNPNLPQPLHDVAVSCSVLRDDLLERLDDGPEIEAGLRKLLEAKDCFVRQALIDLQKRVNSLPIDPPTSGYRAGGPNG